MTRVAYHDLQSFVRDLEAAGELRRIGVAVDPRLEITEIYDRVVKREGPALLFERVEGSEFPLLINPLGSPGRVELALGRPPEQIGEALLELAEAAQPPQPRRLWSMRGAIKDVLLGMRSRRVRRAPVHEVEEEPRLSRWPVQTCWPGDGGPFITFGVVITRDPVTGERNVGVYRMHVYDERHTGMHWQLHKGGGFHYDRAERLGRPLEVAVAIGVDPCLLISAVAALPEGMDEISFAGLLRRSATRMVPCKTVDIEVPASAEIVLEGVVPPEKRREEGPFGDHFGHYSHAAPFPVFEVRRVTRRHRPLYLSATVGKPPQEDKHIGNAVQHIVGPLIKVIHPEIRDLWAYFEAGFHNLLAISMDSRYYKEAVRTALGLMGTGQLTLTKVGILVDADVDVRDFRALLRAIRDNFEPSRDFLLLPRVPQDTLDFTSYTMNLGSKMVLDATSGASDRLHGRPGADLAAVRRAAGDHPPALEEELLELVRGGEGGGGATGDSGGPGRRNDSGAGGASIDPRAVDDRVRRFRVLEDCLLVVQVEGDGREVVERLVSADTGPIKIVAAVSEDVPLDDRDLLVWGIFTRFDCARDVVFTRVEHRGPWTTCHGVMGIDATFKPGYPEPLTMDPEVVGRVDRRWGEYGIE